MLRDAPRLKKNTGRRIPLGIGKRKQQRFRFTIRVAGAQAETAFRFFESLHRQGINAHVECAGPAGTSDGIMGNPPWRPGYEFNIARTARPARARALVRASRTLTSTSNAAGGPWLALYRRGSGTFK